MTLLGATPPEQGTQRALQNCVAVLKHEAVIHRALPPRLSWKTLIRTLTGSADGAHPAAATIQLSCGRRLLSGRASVISGTRSER